MNIFTTLRTIVCLIMLLIYISRWCEWFDVCHYVIDRLAMPWWRRLACSHRDGEHLGQWRRPRNGDIHHSTMCGPPLRLDGEMEARWYSVHHGYGPTLFVHDARLPDMRSSSVNAAAAVEHVTLSEDETHLQIIQVSLSIRLNESACRRNSMHVSGARERQNILPVLNAIYL